MCRFACPVSESTARESLTPWGKMSAGYFLQGGQLSTEEAAGGAYACTGCNACTDACEWDNDVTGSLVALRGEAIREGVATKPVKKVLSSFEKYKNPKNRILTKVLDQVVPGNLLSEDLESTFFPGCETLAQAEKGPLGDMVKILSRLGHQAVGVFPQDLCCGLPLYWTGDLEAFDVHTTDVIQALGDYKTLIVGSASCTWAFSSLYPSRGHDLGPKILHASEFLATLLEQNVLPFRRKFPGPVYYHDPCTLARRMKITQAPRKILEVLVDGEIKEFSSNKENSVCCGAEGLLPLTLPDAALAMARDRLQEPSENGSPPIVSGCPGCTVHLNNAGGQSLDLVTLLAHCL